MGFPNNSRVIIHAPTFQIQYHAFWESPKLADDSWLALLLSIASMGCLLKGHASGDTQVLEAAEFLRRLAAHALARAKVSMVRPFLIEALLIYGVTSMYTNCDIAPEIWHLMSFIVRLCFQAGLHREVSSCTNPRFTSFEIEMRRRIWMIARDLDISTSSISGNPCSINFSLCDTEPPSNMIDADFSPDGNGDPRSEQECTMVQVQICYSRIMEILGKATILSHHVTLPCRDSIEGLGHQLQRAKDELPEQLRLRPLDESLLDPPPDIMNRFRFEFAYQRTKCVLYRRFLGSAKDTNAVECIRAAKAIVQCCIALLANVKEGRVLASFKLFSMRHVHDFLLAAMLICSEMRRQSPTISDWKLIGRSLFQACTDWLSTGLLSARLTHGVNAVLQYLRRELPQRLPCARGNKVVVAAKEPFEVCSYVVPPNLASWNSSFRFDTASRGGFEFDVDAEQAIGMGGLLR